MIQKLEENFKKFNYNYNKVNDNEIILFADFNIEIKVVAQKNDNKFIIQDKVTGWNPSSGIFSSSIDKIFKNSTIILIICFVILEIIKIYRDFDANFYLIIFCTWQIIWNTYYLVKINYLKNRIIMWLS